LRSALERFRDLQGQCTAVSAELRQAIAELQRLGGETATGADPLIKSVTALNRQLRALSDQARDALTAVVGARAPFISAVVAALAPHRQMAARLALDAATSLVGALDLLAKIDGEVIAVGGSPDRSALPQHRAELAPTLARLRAIVGTEP
jgi:hypothetical protein